MDSLDFINTHKLILNNKEIDTIETNGNTDNKTILTKSAINNAISEAISGGGTLIGEYKSTSTNPKIIINESNGIILNNQSVTSIETVTQSTTDNNIITSKGFTEKTYAKLSGASFTGPISSNSNISTTGTITSDGLTISLGKSLSLGNNSVSSIETGTSDNTKLTTLGYNNDTYAKLSNSSQTITSGTIVSTTIKTASSSEKVNINDTNGIITNKIKIGGSSAQEISSVIIGSGTTTDSGTNSNLYTGLKIDNLLDTKVNTSSVKTSSSTSNSDIYACTYINTQLNNKINTSSVKNTSSSTSTSDIYCCKYIDDNYAKLSGNNTFSGTSNTFNNVIYTNGGISAFTTSSSTNPNHIKMKFVDNTVSSVDNDYVEFIDDNTTPNTLLRIYQDGKTYSPVFTTQNADYAELFEVYDESIPIKDYEYKFITLIDDKVKIASNEDDYILGIYSLKPGIIGNYNLNDLNDKKNIQVGLLGRLVVIDNNTCKSNSYCKVDKDGYAIPYNKSDGDIPHYRVMKRIDNNKILIMFK